MFRKATDPARPDQTDDYRPEVSSRVSKLSPQVDRNLRGIELEGSGDVAEAIMLYEANLAEGSDTPHPVNRLAIIYRRAGRISDEIRVLERGIEISALEQRRRPPSERMAKTGYEARLAKARAIKSSLDGHVGEAPYAGERIPRARPAPKINAAGGARISEAAELLGLPADQAAKAGGALWGDGKSPTEERVDVLAAYWRTFDEIHARQNVGMPTLWGLLVPEWDVVRQNQGGHGPISGLFRTAVPAGTQGEFGRLWGTTMEPRWPSRIVSSVSPPTLAAEAFGEALSFWHELALTAWYLCEGPYSRTDIDGIPGYYGRKLTEMEQLGAPVDPSLFSGLKRAERRLRRRQRKPDYESAIDIGRGMSITVTTTVGPGQFDGFEHLRDVVTEHRQRWAERYLVDYLRNRWHSMVNRSAEGYQRLLIATNKPPTLKKYAPTVKGVVNQWFGGDISRLCGAIGQRCPEPVERGAQVMPADRYAFVSALNEELTPHVRPFVPVGNPDPEMVRYMNEWTLDRDFHNALANLAKFALHYVQVREAVGPSATAKDVGEAEFRKAREARVDRESVMLLGDDAQAWQILTTSVNRALLVTQAAAVQVTATVEAQEDQRPC